MIRKKCIYLFTAVLLMMMLIGIFNIVSAAPSSVMKYTFKSEDARQIDWEIAKRIQDGEPEYYHYYYYNYYNEGEKNTYNQNQIQGTIYKYGEEGSTYVWVDGKFENGGYIETYVNTDNGSEYK